MLLYNTEHNIRFSLVFLFLDPPPLIVKRCLNTDLSACRDHPDNPCCSQYNVDRFFPIGPYIQPSLLENWISALFEFSGQNPVAFTWIKTVTIFAFVATVTLLWGLLGQSLGVIKNDEFAKKSDDSDIIFGIDGNNWLEQLESKQTQWKKASNNFFCCMDTNDHFKCLSTKNRKKLDKAQKSKLKCLTDLIYQVRLNSKENNEIKS
jgi:hypothetical protein